MGLARRVFARLFGRPFIMVRQEAMTRGDGPRPWPSDRIVFVDDITRIAMLPEWRVGDEWVDGDEYQHVQTLGVQAYGEWFYVDHLAMSDLLDVMNARQVGVAS